MGIRVDPGPHANYTMHVTKGPNIKIKESQSEKITSRLPLRGTTQARHHYHHLGTKLDRLEVVVVPFKGGKTLISSTAHCVLHPCGSYRSRRINQYRKSALRSGKKH